MCAASGVVIPRRTRVCSINEGRFRVPNDAGRSTGEGSIQRVVIQGSLLVMDRDVNLIFINFWNYMFKETLIFFLTCA